MLAAVVITTVFLLVVTFLVATLRRAVVSGQLSELFRVRRTLAGRHETEVLADALRIKRALDAEAFATHQRMLRVAQEQRDRHQ